MAMIKKTDNSKNWWARGKDRNPFILLLGKQNATATSENSWSVPQMVPELLSDPAIPLVGTYSREMKTCLHKHLHKNVYSSVIYNCPEVETTQMSLNWWTDLKKKVVLLIL